MEKQKNTSKKVPNSSGIFTPYKPTQSTNLLRASLFKRFGAMLYDGLAVLAILMLVAALWLPANHGRAIVLGNYLYWPMQFSFVMTIIVFFSFFWWRDGQTLGMRAWRLRVQCQSNGANLNFKQAFCRLLGAFVSFSMLGLGYFWILIDPTRQTWHDKWTQTEVVVLENSRV